jgi:hypothetical protein
MPYAIRKNRDGSYRVVNADTGKVHMKSGTKADAEAQVRLLHGVDEGWTPTGRRQARRNRQR